VQCNPLIFRRWICKCVQCNAAPYIRKLFFECKLIIEKKGCDLRRDLNPQFSTQRPALQGLCDPAFRIGMTLVSFTRAYQIIQRERLNTQIRVLHLLPSHADEDTRRDPATNSSAPMLQLPLCSIRVQCLHLLL